MLKKREGGKWNECFFWLLGTNGVFRWIKCGPYVVKVFNPTKIYVEWGCKCLFYYIRRNITDINIDASGAILQRKFQFDLKQLSTLITYCLMPAAVFVNIYDIRIEIDLLLQIIYYLMLYSLSLIIVSHFISKILKLEKEKVQL